MFYGDGSRFEGTYAAGKMHGHGTYVWATGVKYVGDWADDKRHGVGTMYYADGELAYKARWSNDQRVFED
jgi:hypothetical protein